MPATRGHLRKFQLNGAPDTSASTRQLPSHLTAYPAHTVPTTTPERNALHRQGFSRDQLATMGKLVQEKEGDFDIQQQLIGFGARDGAIDDEHAVTGPEFLFHGSKSDWDTIFASGGLKSQGPNVNLGAHVHSSTTAQSAFVSGTRVLSVAKSFATDIGWIYLLYVPTGVGVFHSSIHKQAEVAAIQSVPIADILMCKEVAQPNLVYVNQECRSILMNAENLERCLRLIGGGTYGTGQFWTVLT